MVLMGPPGAGKGTQAKLLEECWRIPHVSSGDLLRQAAQRKMPIGVQAKRFMDRGQLVPDAILVGVIEGRLERQDCAAGFVLDGFPRTVAQAEALSAMLERLHSKIDWVVSITVPRKDLVKRMSGRRSCRTCGALYHVVFDPPVNAETCNKCNGELFQRDDDQEDTILARLDVYEQETEPLLALYRAQGILREIDGVGSQSEVLQRILAGAETDG